MNDDDGSRNGKNSLVFPQASEQLGFTGERYTSNVSGPIRHQHHHRYLFAVHYCTGRDVLDVACGEGYGSALLGTMARTVVGVDLDPETVAFARRNYETNTVSFEQGDATKLEATEQYDVVVSFETIEHFVDHDSFLKGVCRALRPGGLLIISSPDKAVYTEADGHENKFHLHELSRDEFKKLIAGHFAHVAILEQDSLTGSWIGPEGGKPAPFELFCSDDATVYRRTRGAPFAHYLIALASDSPLPSIVASAVDDTSWSRQTTQHIAHAVALGREVEIRDEEIRRLNHELRTTVDDRNRQIDELNRQLDERNRQVESLGDELSTAQGLVGDLRRDSELLRNTVDERDRQLAAVFASTSWRISAPVRRVGIVTAAARRRLRAATTPPARWSMSATDRRPSVLFVDWFVPTPDQDSGSVDLQNQQSLLQVMGYKVAFLPVVSRASDDRYVAALRKAGVHVPEVASDMSVEQILQNVASEFDLIFLNRVHVATRLLRHIRSCAPTARIVFNTVDLHFLREEREAAHEGSQTKARAAAQRRRDELRCVAEADATIVLSSEEGRLLSSIVTTASIHVIPFARTVSEHRPPFEDRSGILFVGGFLHSPNVDAVKWLVRDIWPKIRRTLPTATLEIVGSNAPAEVLRLEDVDENVVVRGFVQDLSSILSRVKLTVAPLRFGAGIKGKVAMSLSAGVPCVATPIASEGMGLVDGKTILIGNDADEIASAVARAYEDPGLWLQLSNNGLVLMRESYSFERVAHLFIEMAKSLGAPVPSGAEQKVAHRRRSGGAWCADHGDGGTP